jgi:hypothetical protein
MKIDREKHPFLSKIEFAPFIEQLTPLEIAQLLESLEDSDLVATSPKIKPMVSVAQSLDEMVNGLNEIEHEVSRLRRKVDEWIKSPNSSESAPQIPLTGTEPPIISPV